jgi:hypothetical protein
MLGRVNQIGQMAAVIEMSPDAAVFKGHVRQIIESPAFRGSRRSQEFLRFIVDRALDGHFDELKERSLGVELFGREPSYDTGEDSIVRVTACDVRKRLVHFYAEFEHDAGVRIELHPGSYIPEFHNAPSPVQAEKERKEKDADHPSMPRPPAAQQPRGQTLVILLAIVALGLALDLSYRFWGQHKPVLAQSVTQQILPWSALSLPARRVRVIFCDPDIVSVQRLLNYSVSLSDYANQRYWPDLASQKPDVQHTMQVISFRGATMAAVDVGIVLGISHIASMGGARFAMITQAARNVRLADFKTDDSFVVLGSPRSNPWGELFEDQLDFSFRFDAARKAEFIFNKHPRAGEFRTYVPTTEGWGTGQAYSIVALVGNPNQAGQVLLLGGSTAEATEAAGKLATNQRLLSGILKSHGIDPAGPPRHFEILLRVSTMAGSSNTFDVMAVHSLL